MLILRRKLNEAVIIEAGGHRIVVKVVSRGRRRLALAFEAPDDVKILRAELDSDGGARRRRGCGLGVIRQKDGDDDPYANELENPSKR